ncbi:MAG: gliding motility-associated C-terminal domain-containing protein [Bacteroidaceae bacterium]|nr:gliding motility-associated C-terminal domain-containing protein [Bacteroidaceae bacterium]
MKKLGLNRLLCAAAIAAVSCLSTFADTPQVQVKVILLSVSGDSTVIMPGESSPTTLNVPLRAEFVSELVADDGKDYVLFPQWTVTRTYTKGETSETVDYLKRQESVTEYEFTDYGKFQVSFAWSYREKDALETIPGAEVAPMDFTIDDSEIKLYNAFSPNGDGINDVYKIYTRSIVRMNIAIFNRWGQTIKTISGRMDEILPPDAEPDNDGGYLFEIWDGTFHGDVVNDGVYFINVQATGAGGRKYEEKSDINVLKGLGVGN